ncbi:hypothetical protein WISP_83569 [Willisornis vidua]|uniref:Uncharacterized protein n=1 Tax=Willisornis vidua TaxID=1566151 RepID=A0ABQ9D8B6_9PASS|nr:hypothetical protein WISP_83569 [Willisornis vidua]
MMLCVMPPKTWLALLAARALLAHIRLAINQDPQFPFSHAAPKPLVPHVQNMAPAVGQIVKVGKDLQDHQVQPLTENYHIKKNRQWRQGGDITLYIKKNGQLECMKFHLGVDEEMAEGLRKIVPVVSDPTLDGVIYLNESLNT